MPARAGGTWSRPTWNRPIRQILCSDWERADRARPKPTPEITAANAVRRVGPTRPEREPGDCAKFMSWGQVCDGTTAAAQGQSARPQGVGPVASRSLPASLVLTMVRLLASSECCQGSKRLESGCLFWPGVKERSGGKRPVAGDSYSPLCAARLRRYSTHSGSSRRETAPPISSQPFDHWITSSAISSQATGLP